MGKSWSTPGCGVWVEVTFLSDRKLKKFLQSKKKVEVELSGILSQHQSQVGCVTARTNTINSGA